MAGHGIAGIDDHGWPWLAKAGHVRAWRAKLAASVDDQPWPTQASYGFWLGTACHGQPWLAKSSHGWSQLAVASQRQPRLDIAAHGWLFVLHDASMIGPH